MPRTRQEEMRQNEHVPEHLLCLRGRKQQTLEGEYTGVHHHLLSLRVAVVSIIASPGLLIVGGGFVVCVDSAKPCGVATDIFVLASACL